MAAAEHTGQYDLLTSTRYDEQLLSVAWNTKVNGGVPSRFMLLRYHFDRLAAAAEQHGWNLSRQRMVYAKLVQACEDAVASARAQSQDGPLKIRVLLLRDGSFSASAAPVASAGGFDLLPDTDKESNNLIYVDSESTIPSMFTSTKTTHRSMYNSARSRVGLSPMPTPSDAHIDVLLYTPGGYVMETSIRNVAFRRDNVWVTPIAGCGCLPGVMRRLMLEENCVNEANVDVSLVAAGEVVMTFNGLEGVRYARIATYTRNA